MGIENQLLHFSGEVLGEQDTAQVNDSPIAIATNESVWNSTVSLWPEEPLTELIDSIESTLAELEKATGGKWSLISSFRDNKDLVFSVKGDEVGRANADRIQQVRGELSPSKVSNGFMNNLGRALGMLESNVPTYKTYANRRTASAKSTINMSNGTKRTRRTYAASDNNSR